MKDIFIFEGKNYISARRASEISEYSSDYIGQLCRADKLDCRMVGRAWFVTLDSIEAHKRHVLEVESDPSRVENIRSKKVTSSVSVPTLAPTSDLSEVSREIAPTTSTTSTTSNSTTSSSPVTMPGLVYASDVAPLLPVLNKTQSSFVASSPVRSDTPSTLITSPISGPKVRRSLRSRFALAAVVIVVFIGGLTGYSIFKSPVSSQTNQTASVSGTISSFINFFDRSVDSVLAFFGYPKNVRTDVIAQNNTAPQLYNGMAIIPSDTSATDAQTKQRVRESFSDQVEVHPDQSGTAGVVKPVFSKSKGDDFVYVLVPVKEKKSP